jgi:hypothetical protein
MAAEGTNPYWCDEQTMRERIKFHESVLAEQPDARSIAMFVSKSSNDNFVVYKWENDTSTFKPYWILIKDREEKPYKRSELNAFDLSLYAPYINSNWEITLAAPQLSRYILNLSLNDKDEPTLTGTLDGKLAIVEKAFVEMCPGLLPDVKQMTVYGRCVKTNQEIQEIITN